MDKIMLLFIHISISTIYLLATYNLSKFIFRNWLNLWFIFSLWWLFNLTLVIWNPYNFYPISIENLSLFYSPLLFIPFGVLFILFIVERRIKLKNLHINISASTRKSNVIKFAIFSNLLFSCLIFILSITSASRLGVDIQDFRNIVYFEPERVHPIFVRIIAILWFAEGVNLYTVFYSYYYFLFSKKGEQELNLLLSCFTLILYTLSLGGRAAFFSLMLIFYHL
ncbi:MAG: hypothetical protein HC815_35025 [Richelia sp. RM1_1_1]|nr:hypothetical protein [Richelia sp. RM1_1_1]